MDEMQFLEEHRSHLTGFERVRALTSRDDTIADAADAQATAAEKAAAAEKAESLILANYQAGDPLGQLRRFRVECAAADDRVRDLADQLAKETAKRDRISEAIRGLTAQVDEIHRSIAVRSAPPVDMLAPARQALAEHVEYVARSRQVWQAAQNGTSGPARPFASRGGVAVRSEQPVECSTCVAIGADAWESWAIHHMDPDGNPLAAAPDTPVSVPPDDSERSAARYGREITR